MFLNYSSVYEIYPYLLVFHNVDTCIYLWVAKLQVTETFYFILLGFSSLKLYYIAKLQVTEITLLYITDLQVTETFLLYIVRLEVTKTLLYC